MLETTRKEIGGVTYEVSQLPFAQARKVLVLLSKKVIPGLSLALAGAVASTAKKGAAGLLDAGAGDCAAGECGACRTAAARRLASRAIRSQSADVIPVNSG